MSPDVYWYSCYADICAIADGYDLRIKNEWQRSLIIVQALTGQSISYDDLFSAKASSTEIKSKDDWLALKAKFASNKTDKE